MKIFTSTISTGLLTLLLLPTTSVSAQDTREKQAAATEVWEPVPKIVTPAEKIGDAPSDAIVLFDGKNIDQWVYSKDVKLPAQWTVSDGAITVKKEKGGAN